MAYIRAKKSKRNKRINTTKPAAKAKKRRRVVLTGFAKPILEKTWDKKRTVHENFRKLGLAANPNKALPPIHVKKPRVKPMYIDPLEQSAMVDEPVEEEPVVEGPPLPTETVVDLERLASGGEKLERHISPGEVDFVMHMIKTHKSDYKAMARDKRNYYQHTPKQIKRKVEAFLRSKQCQLAVDLCREAAGESSMES
eukprot:scpid78751/ scgid23651/ Nucleolar protein 16